MLGIFKVSVEHFCHPKMAKIVKNPYISEKKTTKNIQF